MAAAFPITAYCAANALGVTTRESLAALRAAKSGLGAPPFALPFTTVVGALPERLPAPPRAVAAHDARQTRILCLLLDQLAAPLAGLRARRGAARIGIALGTSTGGIAETEHAYAEYTRVGVVPGPYHFANQHLPDASLRVARTLTGFTGPGLVVSTACSSSAKVFGVAQRWLHLGLCDAVLVGGLDTLCQITLRGFRSLELLSETPCRPFARERTGLNIGEGGALLVLEREGPGPARLLGVGETSDAHHMTAPQPEGSGMLAAMVQALAQADLPAEALSHANAHGTGTLLNDAAEGAALARLFGERVPVASTKGYTGHMLGAAGATEAVFAVMALEHGFLPKSLGARPTDPTLPLRLLDAVVETPVATVLSNSFAFGGNNVSLLFGAAA